jgi:hypothetical protein
METELKQATPHLRELAGQAEALATALHALEARLSEERAQVERGWDEERKAAQDAKVKLSEEHSKVLIEHARALDEQTRRADEAVMKSDDLSKRVNALATTVAERDERIGTLDKRVHALATSLAERDERIATLEKQLAESGRTHREALEAEQRRREAIEQRLSGVFSQLGSLMGPNAPQGNTVATPSPVAEASKAVAQEPRREPREAEPPREAGRAPAAEAPAPQEPVLPLVTRKPVATPTLSLFQGAVDVPEVSIDVSERAAEPSVVQAGASDIHVDASDIQVEVTTPEPLAPPKGISAVRDTSASGKQLGLSEFLGRLNGGAAFKRLPKFNWHMPTDPAELQVMGWLEDSDTLERLRSLAKGRLGDERLTQVVFDFYQRSLIDLAEHRA